jgi:glycosyltransferase involved in cell wall biosynthesis
MFLNTKGIKDVQYPLVTIITAVFNAAQTIEKSIQSVINQSYKNIEYIIIDGASDDNTLEILEKYDKQISYWISEPDKGIYHAMNKGLKRAGGEYILILNGDDFLYENAIESAVKKIELTHADYSVGKVIFKKSRMVAKPVFPIRTGHIYQEMFYPHVGALISKKVYDKTGFFNCAFKIAADFDMALKIHLSGFKACLVDEHIMAELSEGGISSTHRTNYEFYLIARIHGRAFWPAFFIYMKQLIKIRIFKFFPVSVKKLIFMLKRGRYQIQ